jgi:uncharacterized tellurite resistance protein B-like protein
MWWRRPATPSSDTRVAVCALLLELAHADDEFAEEERHHLESVARAQFGLGVGETREMLNVADRERATSGSLLPFTDLIRANYSTAQKSLLAEIMRSLVHVDGDFTGSEEYLVQKISHLISPEVAWT